MTKKITVKEVKKKLRRISNERGYEYTYENPTYENEYGELVETLDCHYSDSEGNPSCIVGVLLHDMAPGTYRMLHQIEWAEGVNYEPEPITADHLCGENGIDLHDSFEPEAVQALIIAQRMQDRGKSWGEAVDEVAERY